MFNSNSNTHAVLDEAKDSLLDDYDNSDITGESLPLDESISASLDQIVPTLFNSHTSLKSNKSSSQGEQNSLQEQFNFDSVLVINNSRSFDLEPSFSWIRDEFPVSQNFLSQQLFNNVNAGLSSKGAFSETYNNQISNYAYDASLETAQAVYLGYFQGTLEANSFTYTAGNGNSLAVISGNGNINYGSGYYDSINFSQISVNQVVDYSFAEIGSGGEIFNPGDGDRVFDYITLDNGTTILFEGIDKIYFSEGEIDLTVNPNDTGYLDQWNLHMMGVQNAWRFTTGSDDVLIGVQDSGLGVFNGNFHPDLNNTLYYADNVADEFYREVPGDSRPQDSSHGTAVQGIIGAATDNGFGIAGINWDSYVFNIDVLDANAGDLSLTQARACSEISSALVTQQITVETQ